MRIFGSVSEGGCAGSLCPGSEHFGGDLCPTGPCTDSVRKGLFRELEEAALLPPIEWDLSVLE